MPLSIMIVEDNHFIALDLQDLLEGPGHKVVGHVTGFGDALALARKKKPRVALIDMDLRGERNGLDVAEALAEEAGIRPLFITSRDDYLVRAMALPVEPLGYITKPYQAEEILKALADLPG